MKYFHALWKLDNNRYAVRCIDWLNECVDLQFGNIEIPFSQIELIEVKKDDWLDSDLTVLYSPEVDGDLRTDRSR
ncbi:hypothetical protein MACA111363_02805 [Macrococcoides canis]|uniref:Uncharacterized protein n=1 Tax=Macrococcoides canis TaxID=1855823 RepID=A0A1W7ADA0_9STAP|nr:hypothetical protein [Macrococcus canis]ARQ07070.1 hypothetical protein MCCS_14290 [Macrococcus canis]